MLFFISVTRHTERIFKEHFGVKYSMVRVEKHAQTEFLLAATGPARIIARRMSKPEEMVSRRIINRRTTIANTEMENFTHSPPPDLRQVQDDMEIEENVENNTPTLDPLVLANQVPQRSILRPNQNSSQREPIQFESTMAPSRFVRSLLQSLLGTNENFAENIAPYHATQRRGQFQDGFEEDQRYFYVENGNFATSTPIFNRSVLANQVPQRSVLRSNLQSSNREAIQYENTMAQSRLIQNFPRFLPGTNETLDENMAPFYATDRRRHFQENFEDHQRYFNVSNENFGVSNPDLNRLVSSNQMSQRPILQTYLQPRNREPVHFENTLTRSRPIRTVPQLLPGNFENLMNNMVPQHTTVRGVRKVHFQNDFEDNQPHSLVTNNNFEVGNPMLNRSVFPVQVPEQQSSQPKLLPTNVNPVMTQDRAIEDMSQLQGGQSSRLMRPNMFASNGSNQTSSIRPPDLDHNKKKSALEEAVSTNANNFVRAPNFLEEPLRFAEWCERKIQE